MSRIPVSRAHFPDLPVTAGRGTAVVHEHLADVFDRANGGITAPTALRVLGVSLAQWARDAHDMHEILDRVWRSHLDGQLALEATRDAAKYSAGVHVRQVFLRRRLVPVNRFDGLAVPVYVTAVRLLEEYGWLVPVRGTGPAAHWSCQDGTPFGSSRSAQSRHARKAHQ